MKNLTLSGGFHNSSPITIRVADHVWDYITEGGVAENVSIGYVLAEYLTPYQLKRLDNHFCGIKGCTCGSYSRSLNIHY